MYDLHIIGGGPAGCFAGIAAVMEGRKVLLSEEHNRIGEPEACSGLVSKSGLDALLPYVNYKKVKLNEIDSAKIICGAQEVELRPKKEKAILICRKKFDKMAADRFLLEGGKLELGKKVTRKFEADVIVGADGPASAIAQHFGFPKLTKFVATIQGDFEYSCENPRQVQIYLSSTEFPGFFGWIIPINEEEAKIGVGVRLPYHPLPYFKRFASKLKLVKAHSQFAAVIPLQVRKKTAMQKGNIRVVLAGDAAGHVKATTGGGIFFGASCGLLAGRYAFWPEKYEKAWRKEYESDLWLHSKIRDFLDLWDGQPPALLFQLAKAFLFDKLISKEGRMDRLSLMFKPSLVLSYGEIIAKSIVGVFDEG
ncbi:MAG: NAD(P)/FAD-dependent oxidoreductase [Candidatus Anstonellaceae archaeon]